MKPDLSIGQRLALSFSLLLLILAAGFVALTRVHDASARAQAAYTQHIAPLMAHAVAVERAVYQLGISARAYLISATDSNQSAYRAAADAASSAMRSLHEAPKYDVDELLYRELAPQVYAYMLAAADAVQDRGERALSAAAEKTLSDARERAIAAVRDFSLYQESQARAALTGMAFAREAVEDHLLTASLLGLLALLGLGFLTARSITKPAHELLQVARGFEIGLWKPALALAAPAHEGADAPEPRNEMSRLARAVGAAAAALERREQRLYADGQIAAATASSLNKVEIGEAALLAIVEHVRAEAAVLYMCNGTSARLEPIATYALDIDAAPLQFGDGMPGEAAKTRRPIVANDIPPDTVFRVKLGFDEVAPKAIAAVPMVFRRDLIGVLVVASLRTFEEGDVLFLRAASAQVAIGLRNAATHEDVQRLLTEVEVKTKRVEAQNEKLQAQNEEIQAQDEELQAQSEEIRSQNELLREHAEHLTARAHELTEADARKKHFLAMLAHELRNPLAAISNALSLLEHAENDSEQAVRARAIVERQTQHLNRLTEDLLDISRISQGKLGLQRECVDLSRIVCDCSDDLAAMVEERGLTLATDLPPRPVWLHADATRLAQVVANLLGNAIKFTERGKEIIVAVRADQIRQEAVLEVSDEGAGLDPSFIPHLFEPFSQAGESVAQARAGLGLGLAVVKSLVELHGGSVEAQSAGAGRGARFIVRLPLGSPADHGVPPSNAMPQSTVVTSR